KFPLGTAAAARMLPPLGVVRERSGPGTSEIGATLTLQPRGKKAAMKKNIEKLPEDGLRRREGRRRRQGPDLARGGHPVETKVNADDLDRDLQPGDLEDNDSGT